FSLPPDMLNKVHQGDSIIKCPNCYRLLFFREGALEEE
ncbi:C4-type zinc ribbon domain-containing protein, partial [Planctomycetota bacterium]